LILIQYGLKLANPCSWVHRFQHHKNNTNGPVHIALGALFSYLYYL